MTELRLPLYWDAFAPDPHSLRAARVRDAERVLRAAGRARLQVVLVALPLALGRDAVLPRFAIDRHGRGPRCLTEQRVVRGAPRDPFTDALLQEALVRHLERLGRAFANHPALAAWEVTVGVTDLVPPPDVAAATELAALLAGALRRTGDPVRWTLSSRECLQDRGLHPADLAPLVDELAVDTTGAARRLGLAPPLPAGDPAPLPPPGLPTFLALLASDLARTRVQPVGVAVPVPPATEVGDGESATGAPAADEGAVLGWSRTAWRALRSLAGDGGRVGAGPLLDAGPRCAELPLFQARPRRRWLGLLGLDGAPKNWARAAATALGAEPGGGDGEPDGPDPVDSPPVPALAGLGDPQVFFATPDAARDLVGPWLEAFEAWRTGSATPSRG